MASFWRKNTLLQIFSTNSGLNMKFNEYFNLFFLFNTRISTFLFRILKLSPHILQNLSPLKFQALIRVKYLRAVVTAGLRRFDSTLGLEMTLTPQQKEIHINWQCRVRNIDFFLKPTAANHKSSRMSERQTERTGASQVKVRIG